MGTDPSHCNTCVCPDGTCTWETEDANGCDNSNGGIPGGVWDTSSCSWLCCYDNLPVGPSPDPCQRDCPDGQIRSCFWDGCKCPDGSDPGIGGICGDGAYARESIADAQTSSIIADNNLCSLDCSPFSPMDAEYPGISGCISVEPLGSGSNTNSKEGLAATIGIEPAFSPQASAAVRITFSAAHGGDSVSGSSAFTVYWDPHGSLVMCDTSGACDNYNVSNGRLSAQLSWSPLAEGVMFYCTAASPRGSVNSCVSVRLGFSGGNGHC